MAVLDSSGRINVRKDFVSELSRDRTAFGLTRPELLAAIDAIDDWIDSNEASFNTALPQPARSTLTAAQKRKLFMYVLVNRDKNNV